MIITSNKGHKIKVPQEHEEYIRHLYTSGDHEGITKYADGGKVQNPFLGTKLTQEESHNYNTWRSRLPQNLQYDGNYDLKGFWKSNPNFKITNDSEHLPDTYKLPNHPSFSDESVYFNDSTKKYGGHWAETDSSWNYTPYDTNFRKPIIQRKGDGGTVDPFAPKPPIDEFNYNGNTGKSVTTGAVTGAGAGAVAGPWGAVIGGAVGALGGLATSGIDNRNHKRAYQGQLNDYNNYLTTMHTNNIENNKQEMLNGSLGFGQYAMGGEVKGVEINVEGSNKQEGSPVKMKKGELLVKDGRILRNYINIVPHPPEGTNPEGNVTAPEGGIIIPKKYSEEYINRSTADRSRIETSLVSQEAKRNNDDYSFLMDNATMTFKDGGSIHIKKANRGKFTASANRAGMGVQEYAKHILDNKGKRSSMLVKRANFAKNASGWKHENGGPVKRYDENSLVYNPYKVPSNPQSPYEVPGGVFNNNPLDRRSPSLYNEMNNYSSPEVPQGVSPQSVGSPQSGGDGLNRGNGFNAAMNFLPIADNLARGIFDKPATLNPNKYMTTDRLKWKDISADSELQDIKDSYSLNRYNRVMSGNHSQAGDILSADLRQRQLASMRERLYGINSQGRLNTQQANLGIDTSNKSTQFTVDQYNQQAEAAKRNAFSQGITDLGKYGANKEYKNDFFDVLPYMFDNPNFQTYLKSKGYNKQSS